MSQNSGDTFHSGDTLTLFIQGTLDFPKSKFIHYSRSHYFDPSTLGGSFRFRLANLEEHLPHRAPKWGAPIWGCTCRLFRFQKGTWLGNPRNTSPMLRAPIWGVSFFKVPVLGWLSSETPPFNRSIQQSCFDSEVSPIGVLLGEIDGYPW